MSETKTPITDAAEFKPPESNGESDGGYVSSTVARQLEKRLAKSEALGHDMLCQIVDGAKRSEQQTEQFDLIATGLAKDLAAALALIEEGRDAVMKETTCGLGIPMDIACSLCAWLAKAEAMLKARGI